MKAQPINPTHDYRFRAVEGQIQIIARRAEFLKKKPSYFLDEKDKKVFLFEPSGNNIDRQLEVAHLACFAASLRDSYYNFYYSVYEIQSHKWGDVKQHLKGLLGEPGQG